MNSNNQGTWLFTGDLMPSFVKDIVSGKVRLLFGNTRAALPVKMVVPSISLVNLLQIRQYMTN